MFLNQPSKDSLSSGAYCKAGDTVRNLEQPGPSHHLHQQQGKGPFVPGTKDEQETLSSLQSWQQMPLIAHTYTIALHCQVEMNWSHRALREMASSPTGAVKPAFPVSITAGKKRVRLPWQSRAGGTQTNSCTQTDLPSGERKMKPVRTERKFFLQNYCN